MASDRALPPEKQEYLDAVERALTEGADPAEIDGVADECPTCGAYMLNPALHADWHHKWQQRIGEIADEARRYKSPPTYGGGR